MFARNDRSVFGQWWWSIDRGMLLILLTIITIGVILSFSASPALATQLGLSRFYFVKRHLLYLMPSLCLIVGVSLCNHVQIRKLSFVLLLIASVLLVLTPFWGMEIKGAKRWITLGGMSVQISEFIKPLFAIMTGWLLAKQQQNPDLYPGLALSIGLLLFLITCFMMQPDLGMTIILVGSWFVQIFVAGLPYIWIVVLLGLIPVVFFPVYLLFPHVSYRIHMFLSRQDEQYQVMKSLQAIAKGGLTGVGPGEGVIKKYVPDAHADFIFAVIGEEFGIIFCMVIIALYMSFLIRSALRITNAQSFFAMVTASGLLAQLSMQTLINISSSLGMIPTKGMTLPFISYGGSSLLALALSCGMLLSLTKKDVPGGGLL
jgi:cell division protein FtsW